MFPCSGGFVARSCLILASPWGLDRQAPLSMEFPRKEYWSGLPFPSPGDLTDPGMKPALAGDSLPRSHQETLYVCAGIYKEPRPSGSRDALHSVC